MRPRLFVLAVVLAFPPAPAAAQSSPPSLREVFRRVRPSVVVIATRQKELAPEGRRGFVDMQGLGNWLEHGSRMGKPLVEKRLTSAIEQQLEAKGLKKSDRPDLLVVMHTRLGKETQFTATGFGYGPGRWGRGVATTRKEEIPVGTLMVDLVDATSKELVWRGTASVDLDRNASAQVKDKETQKVVSKMFAGYPPRP